MFETFFNIEILLKNNSYKNINKYLFKLVLYFTFMGYLILFNAKSCFKINLKVEYELYTHFFTFTKVL